MTGITGRLGRLASVCRGLLKVSASLVAAVLLWPAARVAAVDGQLDPKFDSDGRVSYFFDEPGSSFADLGIAGVMQSGQRLVLVGWVDVGAGGFRIGAARLLPDGGVDPSFGVGGEVILTGLNPGFPVAAAFFDAVAQADDKILITGAGFAGSPIPSPVPFILRLTADGFFDPTFSSDGILQPADLVPTAIAAHPDGTIWVAGTSTDMKVVRLASSGAVLSSLVVDFFPAGGQGAAWALAVQPGGQVVACGFDTFSGTDTDFAVARFTAAGALDTSFSGDGKQTVAFDRPPDLADSCSDVALDPEGRIVLVGTASTAVSNQLDFALARLTANGSFDAGFGTGGGAFIPSLLDSDDFPALMVQSDSKLVTAADILTGDPNNVSDALVYRLTAQGELDLTFGSGFGGILFDMAPDGTGDEGDRAFDLVSQGGRAVVVGTGEWNGSDTDYSAARLTSDLIFANGFNDNSTFWWSARVP